MKTTIKVGDILAGTWGYSMVIPCFYKVIKLTEKRAKVIELGRRMVSDDGYGQRGYEVPTDYPKDWGKEEQARPYKDGEYWLVGSRYSLRFLSKWDGKPIWADYMD